MKKKLLIFMVVTNAFLIGYGVSMFCSNLAVSMLLIVQGIFFGGLFAWRLFTEEHKW